MALNNEKITAKIQEYQKSKKDEIEKADADLNK